MQRYSIVIILMLLMAVPTFAAEVIRNQVSVSAVSARSGGQRVSGGQVREGVSRAAASVKTVINGQTVTDWREEVVATSGQPAVLEKTFVYSTSSSASSSVVSITAGERRLEIRWLRLWVEQLSRWLKVLQRQ